MYSNYSTYSAPVLMGMKLCSNELEVDFYENVNVWVAKCVDLIPVALSD